MPQTLSHSPAQIVRQLLIDLSLGTLPSASGSWPVYATHEPNTPDDCVTVYDTAGTDDGRSMISGELWGHDGFQVRVRGKDHDTGWLKADAIQAGLAESVYDRTVRVSSSAYLVHAITRIGDVLTLGTEAPTSKRSLFTINATLSVKQLS